MKAINSIYYKKTMRSRNTYQLFLLFLLQIFSLISFDTLKRSNDFFEEKLKSFYFKLIILNSKSLKDLDLKSEDLNKIATDIELNILMDIEDFLLEYLIENEVKQNALSLLKSIAMTIDSEDGKNIFTEKSINNSQAVARMKYILEKSIYFKIIKIMKIINNTFFDEIYKKIEKCSPDDKFIDYNPENFFAEKKQVLEEGNLIKNKFLAKTRIDLLSERKQNNANLIYKKALILLITKNPNISDENITTFLQLENPSKLLLLTEKNENSQLQIFPEKNSTPKKSTEELFCLNDYFLEEKIKLSNSFHSQCVAFNLKEKESFFYFLIRVEKNNSDAIVNYLLTDKEKINWILNHIISKSKNYSKKKNNNKNLEDNSNRINSFVNFLINQLQDEDKNDMYSSLILITNDKEFKLKLHIIEKNNPKKYAYKAILLNSDKFTSILSINLDLKNNKISIFNENRENEIIDLTKDIFEKPKEKNLEIKNFGEKKVENKLNELLTEKKEINLKKLKIATTSGVIFVAMGLGFLGLLSFNKLKTGNFFPKKIYSFFTEKRFLTEKKITLV